MKGNIYLLPLLLIFFAGQGFCIENNRDTMRAPVPPEIENPTLLGIHKEAAHATLMVYGNLAEALTANRRASTYCRSLNGQWKFNYVTRPEFRPVDFYQPSYDVSHWKEITVPSNWQVLGYGTPYYRNNGYIFQKDFPHVMSEPPKNFTAYEERNPVGSYRREFEVPKDWQGRRLFLTFDGVDAGFFLWINGKKVGYSVNSRNAAEFDITQYVQPGKNVLAVEVYRFCAGSFLEDQDMWRLSGIFRNVSLWSTPAIHIRYYFITTDFDSQYKNATVTFTQNVREITVKGTGFTVVLDKNSGTFSSIQKGNLEILAKQGGPRLHLWRAAHKNDDMWADAGWVKNGLKELSWSVLQATASQLGPDSVQISVQLKGEGKNDFAVTHDVLYTLTGDRTITVWNKVNSNNPGLVVGRMGVRMKLNQQLDQLAYFGRGPMENYSDRKRGFDVGLYGSSVLEQLTPYEKPMDCGNHEDVRWASLFQKNGTGIRVTSDKDLMQITALPYTDEELEKPEYKIDLPKSSATVLCISHQTLGVGSNSCGPKPLNQYQVFAAPTTFSYTLKIE